MFAAEVVLPWPIAAILTLFAFLIALGSAIAFLRSSSVQSNLKLLRDERDDYKAAYEHADEEREKCQEYLNERVTHYEAEIQSLKAKVDTLGEVVSGSHAVKELGDLLLAVEGQYHSEVLGAVRETGGETKTVMEAILMLLGQGGRNS